jgi:hypothetical protein
MPNPIINRRVVLGGNTLPGSLVSYWTLNESSGTRLDSVGSNHLTDNNTVTAAVGIVGNAGQFTAANTESLSIADNALLSGGDTDFTVSAWFYVDSLAANRTVVSKYNTTGNQREYLLRVLTTGSVNLFLSGDGSASTSIATATGAVVTGQWYFCVFWHDSVANTGNVQLNNGTVVSVAHTTGVFDGTADFRIGVFGTTGEPFDGRIDEVGFWRRVLTAAERGALFNSGAGKTYPF